MTPLRRADVYAAALGLAGVAILATLPAPRPDIFLLGLAASIGGMAWRPWVGPAVVGAALPFYFFSHQIGRVAFSPPGLALTIAWLALPVRLAWRRVRRLPPDAAWPATAYDGPLMLFLLASLLSLLVTQYPLLSVRQLRALIFEPVLFFALLAALRQQRVERAALAGFLAAALVAAAAAVAQLTAGLGGTEAEGVRRAQAWYPQPNHLALMLGRALPFFVAIALSSRRAGPEPGRDPGERAWCLPAWLAWLGAGATAAGLLATFSLGGWLGSLVALVVVLGVLRGPRPAAALGATAAAALAAISALAIAGLVPERLNPLRQTTGFRVDLWLSSLAMVRDHPILGVGLDNFVYLYQQVYLLPGGAAEPNLSHPHNWILHVWLQLGLLGLGAFCWLLWRFWRLASAGLRQGADRWMVAAALGSMADTLVHGLIDNSYFLVDLSFLFWLTLALVVPAAHRSTRTAQATP